MPNAELSQHSELIEQIVRRVLIQAGYTTADNGHGPAPGSTSKETGSGPRVLILAPEQAVAPGSLESWEASGAINAGQRITYLPAAGPVLVNGILEAGYHRIILPYVSLKDLADLALGRAAGRIGRLVTELLMSGAKVYGGCFEHDRYKVSAPDAMAAMYQAYERTLATYGLNRLTKETVHGPAADSKLSRLTDTPAATVTDRLITEQRMAELAARGISRLVTQPGCLVTALAKDLARARSIQIICGPACGVPKSESHPVKGEKIP